MSLKKQPTKPKLLPTKKLKKNNAGKTFTIKLDFELHDFSTELSFDQIMDTLFIVGQYIKNSKHDMFNKKDLQAIEAWLERNDLNEFFAAKRNALQAQAAVEEQKQAAKEIMRMPYKKESWH